MSIRIWLSLFVCLFVCFGDRGSFLTFRLPPGAGITSVLGLCWSWGLSQDFVHTRQALQAELPDISLIFTLQIGEAASSRTLPGPWLDELSAPCTPMVSHLSICLRPSCNWLSLVFGFSREGSCCLVCLAVTALRLIVAFDTQCAFNKQL